MGLNEAGLARPDTVGLERRNTNRDVDSTAERLGVVLRVDFCTSEPVRVPTVPVLRNWVVARSATPFSDGVNLTRGELSVDKYGTQQEKKNTNN